PGQFRAGLYTRSHRKQPEAHELYEFHEAVGKLGPIARETELELWQTAEGRQQADELAPAILKKKDKRWILIHPGCGADGLPREWPLANYAVLGHWLVKERNAALVLTGGPEERK